MKRTNIILALLAVLTLTVQTAVGQIMNNTPLSESLWRNEQTGGWEIGFFANFAVYDCDFWDYQSIMAKGDRYEIALKNDGQLLKLSVGKEAKDGKRQIRIDGKKQQYSQITTECMPDYPAKDMQTTFKDNGFREGDSITFVGWLRHLPKKAMDHLKDLGCRTFGLLDNRSQGMVYSIPFDSLLRFRLRIPIENIGMLGFRMQTFLVEPGETYFFYADYKSRQAMFMGRNARLQNEMLAHDFNYVFTKFEDGQFAPDSLPDFLRMMKERRAAKETELERLIQANPTLSERFRLYHEGMLWREYSTRIGQARFSMPAFIYPDSVLTMMKKELWDKMPQPYSLFVDDTFLNDYLDMCIKKVPGSEEEEVLLKRVLTQAAKAGEVTMSDDELQAVTNYYDAMGKLRKDIWTVDTDAERDSIVKQFNMDNEAAAAIMQSVLNRKGCADVIARGRGQNEYDNYLHLLDSLGTEQTMRDICLTRRLLRTIDETRQPLHESLVPRIKDDIHNDVDRNLVLEKQAQFVALQQGDLANAASLRPSTDVEGMTDGEKILRKIIEPFKGRLVYFDIWGTWCGPCKEGLSHATELKEALKDHDIVYLYLANSSPDESWKNVIKQYHLTGDNSVHYNLPADQQRAVEQYLSVHSFPTYKLIDREGNIHDLDWRHSHGDLKKFEKEISKYDK